MAYAMVYPEPARLKRKGSGRQILKINLVMLVYPKQVNFCASQKSWLLL
jgi:hypothetical protein